jgi:transcriptional regulator with XRE-family HTH domain
MHVLIGEQMAMTKVQKARAGEGASHARKTDEKAAISRPRTLAAKYALKESDIGTVPPLIDALFKKGAAQHLGPRDLAGMLGISYPYLMHLSKGRRQADGPRGIDREVLKRAAEFLEIPVAQAYVLAGILRPEDFYYKPTLDEKIEAAYQNMRENGLWSGFAPSEAHWGRLPKDVKLTLAVLYEQVVNQDLLDKMVIRIEKEAGQDA